MNKRLLPVLGFALVVSGVATLLVYKMLAGKMSSGAAPPQIQIVVASRDLPAGAVLGPQDVALADWSGPVPKGSSSNVEEFANRGVVAPIYEREAIVQARLAPKGAGGGMAAMIPPGMRAVAVKVNDVVGVAGFVVPGMRVDVIITGTPPNSGSTVGTLARTVLQNIEVLSAGQKIDKTAEGKPESAGVVNLLVTPEQAEVLSLAGNQMHIQLVLRNPLDRDQVPTPGTATAALFRTAGAQSPPVARVPRPRPAVVVKPIEPKQQPVVIPFVVEVFHGGKRSQNEFRDAPQEDN